MAIEKIIVSAEEQRQDSWRLAAKIRASEAPFDLVVGLARGGVPIALYVQEFFLAACPGRPTAYATLRCRSYTDIAAAGAVQVGSLDEVWHELGQGSRVLVVDDVFDRGTTMAAVVAALHAAPPRPLTVKTATLHYKPENSEVDIVPDYWQRRFGPRDWIVYPQALSDFTGDPEGLARMGLPKDLAQALGEGRLS